ncbi:MAG: response regulator [Sphingobacteriales bacterium]|nr:MAG: response regulator [Sphingobacteriales bacterium]
MSAFKQVFIVDDDLDDIEILTEAIYTIDSSVSCHKAMNGVEGLAMLKEGDIPRPDLIFLDLNMPRVNGRQFLERIKRDATLSGIPVVMYSTSGITSDITDLMSLGARHYFVKPDSFSVLTQQLRKLFDSSATPA